MLETVINDLVVDLIGNHPDIVLQGHLGQLLQLLPGVRSPRGIAGIVENQGPGLGGDGLLQLLGGELEAVLLQGLHNDRGGLGNIDLGRIGHPVGRGNDHLVPGLKKDHGDVVEGVLGPTGDDNLLFGILQAIVPGQLISHGLAQLIGARHGSVFGKALLQGLDGSLFYVLGGIEIRLPCTEPHHIHTLGLEGLGFGRDGQGGRGLDLGHPACDLHFHSPTSS